MRILIFFDLPTITSENRREYTRFRKHIIKSGFIMLQESVYSKLTPNATVANSMIENIRKNTPKEGLVQLLSITEKQFAKIEYLIGEKRTEFIDTDERLIIL